MIVINSPRKTPAKDQPKSPEGGPNRRTKPKAPFFAPKNLAPAPPEVLSGPRTRQISHPPHYPPPATLRPLAFRTFTKKHSLTLTSTALQALATFIGRHCGSGWREEGLAEKVLEEVSRSWKNRNGGVIVDGSSFELKDILKTLEGNMSGGKIMTGPRGISRQNSLLLEPSQDAENSKTRLGLRPAASALSREDSQTSFGMSSLDFAEEPEDDALNDVRKWLKVIHAFEQPRYTYNAAKKHFERDTSRPSLLPSASHKTDAFRNRFNVIHQRLLRNESFQPSAVAGARGAGRKTTSEAMHTHKITPIANLLGRHGSHHMLLGMLVVLPTGSLAISDLTGTITLDLADAVAIPEDSAWFAPGMIVLIDGVYEEEEETAGKGLSGSSGVGGTIGGRFQGFFIGQPPCEKRRATLGVSGLDGGPDHTIGGGFGWIDFMGVGSERAVGTRMRRLEQRILRQPISLDDTAPVVPAGGRSRVVILGELTLDQPRSLQALKKILGLYASDPLGSMPMAFIITGNFAAHAVMARGGSGGSIEYKEFFDALASTLADYPTLLTTASFIFVPGDNDGWVSAFGGGAVVPLPRKAVPELFTSRVRRVFAAANAEAGLAPPGAAAESGKKMGGEAVWTTNPSRMTVFGPEHEIVLFRDDISARLRRAAVRLTSKGKGDEEGVEDVAMSGAVPPSTTGEDDTMDLDADSQPPPTKTPDDAEEVPYDTITARKLVKTLLDQGYLAPFRQAARPVHWDYATPLHLYPLPTAMVLVDTSAPPFCISYEGCHVMNPGSVLVTGRKGVARWVEYELGKGGRVRESTF
ncbi:DNA polymerase alpha/epsilon subunit B-domain-containing protein [Lasiosphaeris hirsuta]|uniref:DNA polymerase epsilon subunit B n=1 Tax=Lasiosphaeris hirsuta TaxID=260670 RepID=A0AA40ARG4_9PEZI|nr:DNA polymerase alpha/epsilon subunit B-domain-containing protein [Lasiosphaeris hirsuta]